MLSKETDVPDVSNLSAFGDIITVDNTPLIQLDFLHGVNNQLGVLTAANAGSADTNSGRLRLQSGLGAGGLGKFNSIRPAKYRQGQGVTARFTTVFDGFHANNQSIVGMGNEIDAYAVGFNGEQFGILHRTHSVDNWIPQSTWNRNKLITELPDAGYVFKPEFGNVWMIRYPFLGFGPVHFFALHPKGYWVPVHVIEYPNSSAAIQISNPNLQFLAQTLNSGSATNCKVYVGSVGVFLNGIRGFLGPIFGTSNRKTAITTETNVFTIRNATSYNGVPNRSLIRLKSLSVAWDNVSNTCLLNLRKNSALSGTVTFTPIEGTSANDGVTITAGNSVSSVNTAAAFTGGTIQFNTACGANGNGIIDLTPMDLFIAPGETMSFTITGDASGAARVCANWVEDI